MEYTSLVAIYAAIVATAGAAIQYLTYRRTKANLLIKLDPKHHSFFFDIRELKISSKYLPCKAAIISFKISNTSSLPITIDDAYAYTQKGKNHYHTAFKIFANQELSYIASNGKPDTVCYVPNKVLKLPLRVDAYDTIYGSLRIPAIDDTIVDNKISNLVIEFETPRDLYTYKVDLYGYAEYFRRLYSAGKRCGGQS